MGHSIGELVASSEDTQRSKYIVGWITGVDNLGWYYVEWADGFKQRYLPEQIDAFKRVLAVMQSCDKM